ncbi:MAG: hypothetical protein NVS1B4_16000 [Gemmatimonadaceae bacterium]
MGAARSLEFRLASLLRPLHVALLDYPCYDGYRYYNGTKGAAMQDRVKIGHAHIKVRDLDRAIAFYTGVVGLAVTERVGNHYAFLSGGSAHHDLALQAVGDAAVSPPRHAVGLYHVAFAVADRREFARAWKRVADAGLPATAVDHRISWALYCADPDDNGVEIYLDTRTEPGGESAWAGASLPLDGDAVFASLDTGAKREVVG